VVDTMAYFSTLKMEAVRSSKTSNFTGLNGVTLLIVMSNPTTYQLICLFKDFTVAGDGLRKSTECTNSNHRTNRAVSSLRTSRRAPVAVELNRLIRYCVIGGKPQNSIQAHILVLSVL
jgi:hypothetical protein